MNIQPPARLVRINFLKGTSLAFSGLFFPLLLCLFCCTTASAQTADPIAYEEIEQYEDTLGVFMYAMMKNKNPEERFLACRAFIPMLTKTLKAKNSFQYKFEQLRSISILYPPDSSFRIFTWQLYVDTSEYRYFGAIQMNEADLKLYPLIDRSFQTADVEYAKLDNQSWYGSLYYSIKPFKSDGGTRYLLFGYDMFQLYQRRKVIDVLTIEEDGPKFGAAVFIHPNGPNQPPLVKNRVMLEYGASASVKCNYDDFEKMVIFDHLTPVEAAFPGIKSIKVPDGTYEGYKLKKGVWEYVEKVYDYVSPTPPQEKRVIEKSKDILGRDRGN